MPHRAFTPPVFSAAKFIPICLSICLAGIFFSASARSASPRQQQQEKLSSGNALEITSAEEVIQKWTADQHLYVKGKLGVSKPQLAKLEKWISANGPHWTIVLMQNARDEKYTALDGRKFSGMDAVEYALGHGLANRTDFGSLTHSQTGETDGAVFVLFLQERKFSYYGSDVHDRRRLGESKWIGDLDGEAIRAMRNGGRIIDAVKNTVTSIDRKLASKIAADQRAKEAAIQATQRAKLERRRELDNLRSRLNETRDTMVNRVEESARKMRTAFPEAAKSKLAQPPTDDWKTKLENLTKDADNVKLDEKNPYQQTPDFRKLTQNTDQLRGEIDRHLDWYAAHHSFEEMIAPVEQRLDFVADHPSGVAIEVSDEAFRNLAEARRRHAAGAVEFVDLINETTALVEQGEAAIKSEKQRVAKAQEQAKLVRNTLLIAGAFLTLGLIGLLWWLNLRRRPALRRAHREFDRRSKATEVELASIEAIVARTEQVVGTPESFAAKEYAGQTQKLGNRVLQNVGAIRTLAGEARGVIASANSLLHPASPFGEAANMVSASRYDHCTNLLSGESLRLSGLGSQRGNQRGRLKAGHQHRAERAGGTAKDNHQTDETTQWATFENFFRELRQVGGETDALVDTMENSFHNVAPQLDGLQERLNEALETEKLLSQASRLDRYFPVPAFFEKLLPAAQSDFERASVLAAKDPVAAVSQPLPDGLRKISDGLAVAGSIKKGRESVFPQLDAGSKELQKLGFDIRWIEQQVLRLGERADQLLVQATEQSVAEPANQFDADLVRLGLRTKRCVELAHEMTNKVAPSIETVQKEIDDTRSQLASELNIDSRQVLHEQDYDPDVELEQARKQYQSAEAALDYGGVESVMESLEVLDIESKTAQELLASSTAAVKEFAGNHRTASNHLADLKGWMPDVAATIQATKSKYAKTALIFHNYVGLVEVVEDGEPGNERSKSQTGPGNGPDIGPSGSAVPSRNSASGPSSDQALDTIVSFKARADELITNSEIELKQVTQKHSQGNVLEAANLLALIAEDLSHSQNMLSEIKEHCSSLDKQAHENMGALNRRLAALETAATTVGDYRTQGPTLDWFEELTASAESFQTDFESQPQGRDPFWDHQQLHDFEIRTDELAAMIQADIAAHAEATRAVDGARSQLHAVKKSVARSVNDQIPDSGTIKNCQEKVTQFEQELDQVADRLKTEHDNWQVVDERAWELTSQMGEVDGLLRRELELAQDAVKELKTAAAQIFAAASYKGSYGIRVVGNPGSSELELGRQHLSTGQYLETINACRSARFQAKRGLDSARAHVKKKQRAIAAAAALRRRRSSSSSFGSSFGSSSGSSSRSWSSSSSSRSSSSSGSSGSGFSRSGW